MKRILIANRGEIACRIIRTVQAMGLKAVAVYSDADRDALHVRCADDAVHIGSSAPSESYLHVENILAAAKRTQCDAVHPGYGFLSENAHFADACAAAGLTFVGPSAVTIALMGDKAAAKRHMLQADVPCIPGYEDENQDDARLMKAAEDIGFPVMIKAAAGGGGRGMRRVEKPDKLAAALQTARSEALGAFGDGALIVEKALDDARHVEIQVLADQHGQCIHLGERDCSIQRRHQKIIEESPCPIMTEELRERMGAAAVQAARSIDYVGAGTVEFLLDAQGRFYFLEMNTRLQVEHPVTELVTGLDLVQWQLRIASGERLTLDQESVALCGHAIEARLYAEDPTQAFLPSTGRLERLEFPDGDQVRIDSGFESGSQISPYYDSMVAKVIVHGADRQEALRRLSVALQKTAMLGPSSNRDFLLAVLAQPEFNDGNFDTGFIDQHWPDYREEVTDEQIALASAVAFCFARDEARRRSLGVCRELMHWSSGPVLGYRLRFSGDAAAMVLTESASRLKVGVRDQSFAVELLDWSEKRATWRIDDRQVTAFHARRRDSLFLATEDWQRQFVFVDTSGKESSGRAGSIIAPMHGQVMEVFVAQGDTVVEGQPLLVLEAMKMQHEVCAPVAGSIVSLDVASGQQVAAQSILLEIR